MSDTTEKSRNLESTKEKIIDNSDKCKTNDKLNTTYLVETFYITKKKNSVFQVKLTNEGICLRKESNNSQKEQTILLKDIIGCRCLRSKRNLHNGSPCTCSSLAGTTNLKVVDENSIDLDETDASAYLYIYAYILKKNRRGDRRERTTLTLRFRSFDRYEDNNREAQKWRNSIKQLIKGELPNSPYKNYDSKRLLIILNPKSGSGKARTLFQERVAPILIEAEICYDLQVTKFANYAREYVRTKDIYIWRGIVVIGGDGIYWEVINGLLERSDWKRALNEIPIGIIPCGSGNGLARTLAYLYKEPYEPNPILSSTLSIIRGKDAPMDLVRIETKSQTIFSFLSVGWGLISDIDIESERIRPIGYQRFAIWSVHRLIHLRTYTGKVSYLKIENNDKNSIENSNNYKINTLKHSVSCNNTLDCTDCHGDGECEKCNAGFCDALSLETSSDIYSFRPRVDSWYSTTSRKSAYFSTNDSLYKSIVDDINNETDKMNMVQMFGPSSNIPALTSAVPESWVCEEGEYVMVHASYQTHLGTDCFFAPASKLNDGIIWLLIIRAGVSRPQLLSFLLGLSTGNHLPTTKSEYIEFIPVSAFRIEPTGSQGTITVDGECVEYGPLQGEIFQGIAKVMVP